MSDGDTYTNKEEIEALRYVRIEGRADFKRMPVTAQISLRLEVSPNLLDAWVKWSPLGKHLDVLAGQMKVPSAWEVEESTESTDFAGRSQFAEKVADLSLIRGATMSAAFPGARAYLRDIGVAVRARYSGARLFFMIGNGLGSNFNIGGQENKGFLFANDLGAWFLGIRLEFDAVEALSATLGKDFPVKSFTLGGHACVNRKPQVIMNDERTVVDISRRSWSWELRADVLGRIRLTWMMGAGFVDDDFDHDGKTDYEYRGWEARVVFVILPGVLEAGFRWDAWFDEKSNSGDEEYLDAYTFGVTAIIAPHFRFQLSYKAKVLSSRTRPNLADDVFLLSAQFVF